MAAGAGAARLTTDGTIAARCSGGGGGGLFLIGEVAAQML
jgi:hypothetical protein